MARLVFGMNQSLDGFVDRDHPDMLPDPALFRHFVAGAQAQAGSLCGRKVYGLLRWWDEDQPGWGPDEAAFAAAWRSKPKWVVSSTLKAVDPTALPSGIDRLVWIGWPMASDGSPGGFAGVGPYDLACDHRAWPVARGRG